MSYGRSPLAGQCANAPVALQQTALYIFCGAPSIPARYALSAILDRSYLCPDPAEKSGQNSFSGFFCIERKRKRRGSRPAPGETLPRQNRVTPFGGLIATECRGTLMGNRGCLHDDQQRIRRAFACKRWLVCVLQFRGRHRTIMAPGRYTELFFLDEATALAAGHRPCAECQHARYRLFREVWAAANPHAASSSIPLADEMDRVLHAERVGPGGVKRTYVGLPSDLPAGTMVADGSGRPLLVVGQQLVLWRPGGYGAVVPQPAGVELRVLTPKSVVRALAAGYPVEVHSSANQKEKRDIVHYSGQAKSTMSPAL